MPAIYLHQATSSPAYSFIFVNDDDSYSHFADKEGNIFYASIPSCIEGTPHLPQLLKNFSEFLAMYPNTHLFATPITHPEYFI